MIGADRRDVEAHAAAELRNQGYDCVISEQIGGVVLELFIFDKAIIRYRGFMGAVSGDAQRARASGTFYASDELPGPDFAPGCGLLFSSSDRAEAVSEGLGVRRARVDLYNPIYCDRQTWPRLDLDVLRRVRIDSLIDPATGDVLTLDRRQGQLNRAMRRAMRRKL
jgi:hypothetical protein